MARLHLRPRRATLAPLEPVTRTALAVAVDRVRRLSTDLTYARIAAVVLVASVAGLAIGLASDGRSEIMGAGFGLVVGGVLLVSHRLQANHPVAAAGIITLLGTVGIVAYSFIQIVPAAILLGPIITFLIVLPRTSGRIALLFGAIAVAATLVAYAIAFGVNHQILGVFTAASILLLVLTQQRREIVDLVDRLSALVDDTPVGIVRFDGSGRVVDANAAAARILRRASVGSLIGRRIEGLDPAAAPHQFESGAAEASSTTIQQVDGPDGSRLTIRHLSRPIRDESGRLRHYQSALEDLTEQQGLQDQLDRRAGEQEAVLASLRRIAATGTLRDRATAFCREISASTKSAYVGIVIEAPGGGMTRLAGTLDGDPLGSDFSDVHPDRAATLRATAATGAWIEHLSDVTDGPWRAVLQAGEIRWLSHVGIDTGERTVAHLTVGSRALRADDLARRLPDVREFATIAGALLGPGLAGLEDAAIERARIRAVIERHAFRAVFQPIVDMTNGAVLGFEALTRFTDGMDPASEFAAAERVGLGIELEVATIEAALNASGPLPANAFLDLNVSPALILEHDRLAHLLGSSGWNTVIEITEHVAIDDYDALKAAIARLGPNVRLAVDDAGAGYASLRHIRELSPEFVKLDRDLVTGIAEDATRQAIVAGMQHFARLAGCRLVAEGVETEASRAALLDLGVTLAQGYLFARPAPAVDLVRPAAA